MKQIQGVCTEISEKNGWTTFSIDVGTQYPVRLNTKLPVLIAEGRSAGQNSAVWSFKESQGNENPNRPGTFYMNRYLEGVEVGGTVDPAKAATPAAGGASGGAGRPAEERRSIERQTIIKAMVKIYPVETPEGDAWWWGVLGKLDDFAVNGLPRPQQAQQPQTASGGGSYERDDSAALGGPTPPPQDDDSIPF